MYVFGQDLGRHHYAEILTEEYHTDMFLVHNWNCVPTPHALSQLGMVFFTGLTVSSKLSYKNAGSYKAHPIGFHRSHFCMPEETEHLSRHLVTIFGFL